MLVLTRHKNESIMIGDLIEVTVVDMKGDRVRLGISAPRNIAVHRKEVYEAIRAENIEAARAVEGDLDRLASLFAKHISTPSPPADKPAVAPKEDTDDEN